MNDKQNPILLGDIYRMNDHIKLAARLALIAVLRAEFPSEVEYFIKNYGVHRKSPVDGHFLLSDDVDDFIGDLMTENERKEKGIPEQYEIQLKLSAAIREILPQLNNIQKDRPATIPTI